MNTDEAAAPPSLPWSYRPLGVRVMVAAMTVVVVAAAVFMWTAMPDRVRAEFSWLQRITLLCFFAAMILGLYGVGRSAIKADSRGLRVVNVFKARRLAWTQVVAVRLPTGEPWAVLDIDDGTAVKAMAIQGSDGRRAHRATGQLHRLVEAHSQTPRDD